jgi:PAS domain S-box-containing protein
LTRRDVKIEPDLSSEPPPCSGGSGSVAAGAAEFPFGFARNRLKLNGTIGINRFCHRAAVIDLSRYIFDTVQKDAEFILYRGKNLDAGSTILALSPVGQHPKPESLKRLEHEYSLKEELHLNWAARPLAIEKYWGRSVLVLEDPGGLPLESACGRFGLAAAAAHGREGSGSELVFFLRAAISLADAIDHLHRKGVIHKDIKPANVLVNSGTAQCWLKGFGIASRVPREQQSPEPPEFVAGTLAYMAPEQTGRMNRSIDSRSDLYSLGITLYEMLTGNLPFSASDAMEWVHCHIARRPVPPVERSPDMPAPLSAIVMKLLAKTAEDRYQTAAGVESDLRRCLELLEGASGSRRIRRSRSSGAPSEMQGSSMATADPAAAGRARQIEEFPLGQHDTPDRLLIPEKLYGRAREIEALLGSFERVLASGRPELVLVSGYSGIGKSSVVNELHKVLVPPRGLFASGKFDQYKRDIPYSTLAQAFQNLVRPLLSKSEADLGNWRDALQHALGANGELIADLVPELKLIIGEQPPVPDLPLQDAQRRFQLVFRRFIGVFARAEHPLVLFLDDLQWLDAATLDFLEDLLSQPDVYHLMLIGAYRNNEVDFAHPLRRRLGAIRQAGAVVHEIVLAPLGSEQLAAMMIDSLHCEPEQVAPFAQLLHEKTNGNPFFVVQFLYALVEEQLLTFDHNARRWHWDLNRIRAKGYTDNVVELMVGKLNRLPIPTQKALQELACLGNRTDIATLAMVHGTPEEQVHADLWQAVRLELLARQEGVYKFIHDRIQEAAYSLIPEHSRAETHLKIGRSLWALVPPEKREEAVFEIVNQLNRCTAFITSPDERERLAELNFIAGKRAKTSTAYRSALNYLAVAAVLLPNDSWERWYELTFSIEYLTAECELLTADMESAENRLGLLADRAKSDHDIAVVARLRLTLYTALDRSDRVIEVCLEYLARRGTYWSAHPTSDEARREYDRIWAQLGSRQIEELAELPLMTDPGVLDVLDVLTEIVTTAMHTDENLSSLVVCHMVNHSLEHGNSDASCFAYVWFAIIAGPRFGNYQGGFRFGRLGYELVRQRGFKRYEARTYMSFGNLVIPWARHARNGRNLIQRGFEAANRIGDLTFAAYCRDSLNSNSLTVGDPLAEVQSQAEEGLAFAKQLRFGFVIDLISVQVALIRTLRGLTPIFGYLNHEEFDEAQYEHHLITNPVLALPECWYFARKAQARFLARDYVSALDASLRAQRVAWTSPSQFEKVEFHFYGGLAHAACWDCASSDQKPEHFQALTSYHKRFQIWAEHCPENFENRAALLGAEIARIEGREFAAMQLYEQAIRCARDNGFVHVEGVANEVAARFYVARGFEKIAYGYLREARYCYLRWGAAGKVRQLDELYPQLREAETLSNPTSTIGAPVEHLDLATVIKVSQAVSGEIVLEKLIDTLMRTAIEHAGAERGLLIFHRGTEHRIEAEATTSGETIIVRLRATSLAEVTMPESIVNHVTRTQESVILDDALVQNPFSTDDYIRQQQVRSVLCLPLIKQARLIGVLYLENNLAPHVFTPARIAVLKLLASQTAISLENTYLYRDLEEREARIRRLVDANIVGIFIWNLDGKIIEANEAFLHVVGYRREDLLSGGMRWTDLTPADWRERDERAIAEVRATGSIQPYEKEYISKDGGRVPVLLGAAFFEGSENEGVAFVLDLSDQKRAEEEQKRAQDALLQAQVELARVSRIMTMEQLTSSIAHEVNQPLAAVVNSGNACLNWLSATPPNLRRARDAVERVVRDGNRASDILKRVRGLLKKTPLVRSPLNVNEVVREVLALVDAELRRQNVDVVTELNSELPSVIADSVQLQQVILNLVMNAIESMASIADRPRVLRIQSRVHYLSGQSAVIVAVSDSGAGCSTDEMDRVFEAFYTTKPQGMGMGLWICRSIIEAHGGQLTARLNDDVGATFEFVLPASGEERT